MTAAKQDAPPRVFISYSWDSPEHCDRVCSLANRLRRDGVDCEIDQYNVAPREGWQLWMMQHIEDAEYVLMVCTETYCRRVSGREEPGVGRGVVWEAKIILNLLFDEQGRADKFVPVIMDGGRKEHIPSNIRHHSFYFVEAEGGYDDLFRHMATQSATQRPGLGGGKMPSLPRRTRKYNRFELWNVPDRNPYFTGREEDIDTLRRTLFGKGRGGSIRVTAVHGLGGMGKTQVAVEYAHKFRKKYQAVFWVRAESEASIKNSFVDIGRKLQLPERNADDQDRTIRAVLRWFEESRRWLLLFDNADDPEAVLPYRPKGGLGHILVTSREANCECLNVPEPLMLKEFSTEDAVRFLQQRRGGTPLSSEAEWDAAAELVEALGRLPLALEQAAAYIKDRRARFTDYLASYRRRGLKLLNQAKRIMGDHKPIATTWSISFEKVQEESPASADLLRFFAFLAPDSIPWELVRFGAKELGPNLFEALSDEDDPLALNDLFRPLTQYSLVTVDEEEQTCGMHRMVQQVLRQEMSKEEQKQWVERAVRALDTAFPAVQVSTWPQCDRLIPHARVAANLIQDWNLTTEDAGRLLGEVGMYLYDRGHYDEAESFSRQATELWDRLGSDDTHLAINLRYLGYAYRAQARHTDAEKALARALEISERIYGRPHVVVAQRLYDLALTCRDQNKPQRARELLQQSYEMFEAVGHGATPRAATALNFLGALYRDQERYDEARELFDRSRKMYEDIFGPDHELVGGSLYNLARLDQAMGRSEDAKGTYNQAIMILETRLGPEHPWVADALHHFAIFMRMQQKFSDAEPLCQRALSIREKVLSPNHPDVHESLRAYAALLRDMGRHQDAVEVESRVQAIDGSTDFTS